MERYRRRKGNLFQGGDTKDLEDLLKQQITKEIQNLKDDYVLNVPENQFINYLIEKYRIECPVIQFDQCVVEPQKVLVSSNLLPYSFKFDIEKEIERNMYRFCIPFEGDEDILRFRPSTFFIGGWGPFVFSTKEISIDILDMNNNGEEVKREYQSYRNTLEKMVGFLKTDIERINQSMPEYIRQTFIARKDKIKKDQQTIADIGIPIRSRTDVAKTYSVPTVKKRFEKPVMNNPQKTEPLNPTMADADYQTILQSINTIGKQFEHYPKTVENQDEETIRAQFLTQLSAAFSSYSTTGESFSNKGKTDIMIKHGDGILFVAECKIWKGQRKLLEAIDQLLSYLTWRESKTALLIFNKDTNPQTVVESIQESIPNHPNFVKFVAQRDSGWYDYIFRLTDSTTEIKMSVMVFDFKK